MTLLTPELEDPHDLRLAQGADGLLRTFNEAGVLDAADVHVARALTDLAADDTPLVALAVAFVVRAVRGGSVCVDLAAVADPELGPELPWPDPEEWYAAVEASALAHRHQPGPAAARPRRRAAALPRPLLARGAAGARRPGRPPGLLVRPRRVVAGGGARQGLPGRGLRRAAERRPGRAHPRHDRAHRRSGHRQDHHGRRLARALRGTGRARGPARAPHRPLRAHGQGGRPAAAGGRGGGGQAAARRRGPAGRRPSGDPAPLARGAAGHLVQVPTPPRQPAATRRRGGRRDVDGVAHDDGPPARGGPVRQPADPGR